MEAYAGPYMDFLQAPLQPLMDNLETDTYEGFEKDPIKYQQYEEAVYQAIMDRPSTSNALDIFVCGAGRGPLVAASLKAAKRAGNRRVKITAVEKNANAFVLYAVSLMHRQGSMRVPIYVLTRPIPLQITRTQSRGMGRSGRPCVLRYAQLSARNPGRCDCVGTPGLVWRQRIVTRVLGRSDT